MAIPKKIKSAIENNKLVIFAGSGLSSRFKLPSWKKLVIDIINEIDDEKYKSFISILNNAVMQPSEVLDILKTEHHEIHRYIKKEFNIEKSESNLHKEILDLTSQVITTNYDNAFENNSNIIPTNYTSTFNISEINKFETPYILKLHGSFNEPDNCVIFSDDYKELYSNDKAAIQKLKSIFTDRVILFLGFSFSDEDINLIFDNLDKSFDNNNKHAILTTSVKDFEKYNFLDCIKISDHDEIDIFINECLSYKKKYEKTVVAPVGVKESLYPKVAFLSPAPIDIDLSSDLLKTKSCFTTLECELYVGSLNLRTLSLIEDYDLLVINTKVFKDKLYIEDDNLISNLITPQELCDSIPNDEIPIVFITNDRFDIVEGYSTYNIYSLKKSTISRFIYKAFKSNKPIEDNNEVCINLIENQKIKFKTGDSKIYSLYSNNRDLDIGKKCLHNVVGRVQEQSIIASKILNIRKNNKFLNIKASGGTGKTTLIKKVAYELYNRGYFSQGVTFESCENVNSFYDFEELIISGFNLNNILDFKDYLELNYASQKNDLLVILDNFETVVNNLDKDDYLKAVELIKFATDYAYIVITSREVIFKANDYEDIYPLTPLTTDDALELFILHYGDVSQSEVSILRSDILEDMLNNNPLAIKLVTTSRPKFNHINDLNNQLKEAFFESTDQEYMKVYNDSADLNIERTKSLFQSINYSYITLNDKEKIALEILNLFPDGISLSNFKKCFTKKNSKNRISDREFRVLRDKSLVEDYNGTLQLQPIIRKFAEFKFSIRPIEVIEDYCYDAYKFNCFVLDVIDEIKKKRSRSIALKFYSGYKNNIINALGYMSKIRIGEKGNLPKKNYLLNYIFDISYFIEDKKSILKFYDKLDSVKSYFADVEKADLFLDVIKKIMIYYHQEFDKSYKELCDIHSVDDMLNRGIIDEDGFESRYKDSIGLVHSMEGYTVEWFKSKIKNEYQIYSSSNFYYLGIIDSVTDIKQDSFYFFENQLMSKELDVVKLENYIKSLYQYEHLEIMQCTYTLSKVKELSDEVINKLVVANPYTKGLKNLMLAFSKDNIEDKLGHFEKALEYLTHIKFYYLEALYYYCVALKDYNQIEFNEKVDEGIRLSLSFSYQYLHYLFTNIEDNEGGLYECNYSFYPIEGLEEHVKHHNKVWKKYFKEDSNKLY